MALSQLLKALNKIRDIQKSLDDVSKDWRQSNSDTESLKYVKHAVMWQSQITTASEILRTPNYEGNPGPHCTRDIPAGPLRAGGPGVLIPKKS